MKTRKRMRKKKKLKQDGRNKQEAAERFRGRCGQQVKTIENKNILRNTKEITSRPKKQGSPMDEKKRKKKKTKAKGHPSHQQNQLISLLACISNFLHLLLLPCFPEKKTGSCINCFCLFHGMSFFHGHLFKCSHVIFFWNIVMILHIP